MRVTEEYTFSIFKGAEWDFGFFHKLAGLSRLQTSMSPALAEEKFPGEVDDCGDLRCPSEMFNK